MEYLNEICVAFLLFITYSVLGWLMEVTVVSIAKRKLVDRGFLIGPYCPIYGYGCLILIYLLKKYVDDYIALFCMGAIACSMLEYLTSYIMEKMFKARWWDYSDKKFNINGRICLRNSIAFGFLGVVLLKGINIHIEPIIRNVPLNKLYIMAAAIGVIFILDNICTFFIVSKVKKEGFKAKEDNTEEVTAKIKEELAKGSIFVQRLLYAFPDFTSTIKSRKEELTEKANEIRKRINKEIEVQKAKISETSSRFIIKK